MNNICIGPIKSISQYNKAKEYLLDRHFIINDIHLTDRKPIYIFIGNVSAIPGYKKVRKSYPVKMLLKGKLDVRKKLITAGKHTFDFTNLDE